MKYQFYLIFICSIVCTKSIYSQTIEILNTLDETTQNLVVSGTPALSITSTVITPGTLGQHAFSISDATSTQSGFMGIGIQTFTGAKTFATSLNLSGTSGNTFMINSNKFLYDASNDNIGINMTPQYHFDMTANPNFTTDMGAFFVLRNIGGSESFVVDLDTLDNISLGIIDASNTTKAKFRSNGISFIYNKFTVGEGISSTTNPQFKVVGNQEFTNGGEDMINYQMTVQNKTDVNGSSAAIGFGVDNTRSRIGGYISFVRVAENSFGSMHFGVKTLDTDVEPVDVLILSAGQASFPLQTASTLAVFNSSQNLVSGSIGSGLSLSSGTLSLNINGLTATTEPIQVATDYFAVYDASVSANKKTSAEDILAQYVKDYRKRRFDYYNEFINGNGTTAGGNDVVSVNNGAGAASIGTSAATAGNVVGLIQSTTGTTASGRTAVVTANHAVQLGGGEWVYELGINAINTLSNSTERYQLLVGFFDNQSGVNQTDAVYFLYDEGGVSSGASASANWQLVTASNSTRSFTSSTTSVTTGVAFLKIVINAAGTQAEYFINGTSAGSMSTNIPVGAGRETGFGWLLTKSNGTTARTADIDFLSVQCDYSTAKQ